SGPEAAVGRAAVAAEGLADAAGDLGVAFAADEGVDDVLPDLSLRRLARGRQAGGCVTGGGLYGAEVDDGRGRGKAGCGAEALEEGRRGGEAVLVPLVDQGPHGCRHAAAGGAQVEGVEVRLELLEQHPGARLGERTARAFGVVQRGGPPAPDLRGQADV